MIERDEDFKMIGLNEVPKTLNGYPVVLATISMKCVTVMVDRSEKYAEQPFVVATWWPGLKETWSWGHYCDSRKEAERVFQDVLEMNETR